MCSNCLPLPSPWDRQLDPASCTVTVVGPTHCPNGHRLGPGQVAISSTVRTISYGCSRCELYVNRLHNERVEWVTAYAPDTGI